MTDNEFTFTVGSPSTFHVGQRLQLSGGDPKIYRVAKIEGTTITLRSGRRRWLEILIITLGVSLGLCVVAVGFILLFTRYLR